MRLPSERISYFLGFLAITSLLGFAWYLQKYDGIMPCPLCVLQRLDFVLLGVVFFFGALLPLKQIGHFIIGSLSMLISLLGLMLAGRQIWLQHLPAQNGDCGVSLNYLIQVLPPMEVIKKIFAGSAECSKTVWQFLHLSLAEWTFFWFGVFAVFSIIQLIRALRA